MYINWNIWCMEASSQEMIDRVSRIMQYEGASPDSAFKGSPWWKHPGIIRFGGAYWADRLPENLEASFAALDPKANVNVVDQEQFLEYTLSTSSMEILSSPERVFVACSIYKNL